MNCDNLVRWNAAVHGLPRWASEGMMLVGMKNGRLSLPLKFSTSQESGRSLLVSTADGRCMAFTLHCRDEVGDLAIVFFEEFAFKMF